MASAPLLAILLSLVASATSASYVPSAAFALSTRSNSRLHSQVLPSRLTTPKLYMALPSKERATTVAEIEAQSEELRKEIEELREEALRRLEDLNDKLNLSSSTSSISIEPVSATATTGLSEDELLPAPAPIVFSGSKDKSSVKKKVKGIANLLDETRWKVSLSIGREPGTWMPKEWGKSGQRINISFIAEFTPSQLFEKDDFLRGGYTNAKILHVVNNEIKLGPSVSEGQRVYKVKDGGWQVTRGDGPLGTDLLRFFIEVDENIEHTGGDVSVPKGRVYSSCGYFPFMGDNSGGGGNAPSVKDSFLKELKNIDEQILSLQKAKAEINNPFNLDGIKMSREIFKLNRQAEQVNDKLNFARVQEPDKKLLRFSKDGDVGLTKEGGVCCQVNKGPVVEYHILGRFGIASSEHD